MKKLDELTREDKVACIKNWVEELAQEDTTRTDLLEQYRKLISQYQISTEALINENEKLKESNSEFYRSLIGSEKACGILIDEKLQLKQENEKLKTSKSSSQEEITKLVNDKITMIFSNPLTYLMSLPESERNQFIGKIYTLITGIKFI